MLSYCGQCLVQVIINSNSFTFIVYYVVYINLQNFQISSNEETCKYLVEKSICASIVTLSEYHDDAIKHAAALVIAKLSLVPNLEDLLMMNNVLTNVQMLLQQSHRVDTLCYLILR